MCLVQRRDTTHRVELREQDGDEYVILGMADEYINKVKYCFGGQNAVRGDAAAASKDPHVARDGRSTVASSTCPRKTHLRPQDTSAFDPSK